MKIKTLEKSRVNRESWVIKKGKLVDKTRDNRKKTYIVLGFSSVRIELVKKYLSFSITHTSLGKGNKTLAKEIVKFLYELKIGYLAHE